MQRLWISALSVMAMSACRPLPNESALLDNGPDKGTLRVSMANPVPGSASDWRLVFSAATNVAAVAICATANAESCQKGSAEYFATRPIVTNDGRGRNFFAAEDDAFIEDGLRLLLLGMDAEGRQIEMRRIQFKRKLGGAASAGTSPSASSTPGAGAPAAHESQGTGGLPGDRRARYQESEFLVSVPADYVPSKARGLLVFLHGSTASNYQEWMRASQPLAKEFGFILVSVKAPNGSGWNEGDQKSHAGVLHNLIQDELIKKYNVDRRNIFFQGQSSGAGFLSTHFVPIYGKNYQGGMLMLCGAGAPSQAFSGSEDEKKKIALYFDITREDGIWGQQFAQATARYQQAGFRVSSDNTKPGGHCQFSQQDIVRQQLPKMMVK